jgi:hypothetical protein
VRMAAELKATRLFPIFLPDPLPRSFIFQRVYSKGPLGQGHKDGR